MEQQRERPPDAQQSEDDELSAQTEALPPPPTAFPITELSRIHSQLLSAAAVGRSINGLQIESDRNPFGDSNAVSRNSIASDSVSQQESLFGGAGDEQSLRDDASSMAPPPQYEEFLNGGGEYKDSVIDRRVSSDAPLPSYAAVTGAAPDLEEKPSNHDVAPSNVNAMRSPGTATGYLKEKVNASTEEREQGAQHQPHNHSDVIPTMQQRGPAELSAITDAISRAYASSPSLDNQRHTRTSSRPTSRSGLANGEGERTSLLGCTGMHASSAHPEMDEKGKQRENERGSDDDVVVIEGRRMSRTMAAELFQMWDNIDRAHGNRMSEQTQAHDPAKEAAKLEVKKEAFYQELISKTGQGRFASQDHFSRRLRHENHRPYDPAQDSSEAFIGLPSKSRHPFQPLETPESEKSSLKFGDEAARRVTTPDVVVAGRQFNGQEERPSLSSDQEMKPASDELVTFHDFIKGTEEELITVQDFLKKEIGRDA